MGGATRPRPGYAGGSYCSGLPIALANLYPSGQVCYARDTNGLRRWRACLTVSYTHLSALVTVVAMAWLLLRYLLAVQHTAAPPTVQAARMLQYWATLLLVHASAFAWFRRAASPKSALLGFAGILYLGCGYVFSLALAAIFELAPWPEEWKMVLWSAILPLVAWSSRCV